MMNLQWVLCRRSALQIAQILILIPLAIWLYPQLAPALSQLADWAGPTDVAAESSKQEPPTLLSVQVLVTPANVAVSGGYQAGISLQSVAAQAQIANIEPTGLITSLVTSSAALSDSLRLTSTAVVTAPLTDQIAALATSASPDQRTLLPSPVVSPIPPAARVGVSIVPTQTLTPGNIFATATAAYQATLDARQNIKTTPTPTITPTPFSPFLTAEEQPDLTATAEKAAGEATVNAVLTSVNRPDLSLKTLTPTPTPIVVTATSTPADIFAAATYAAEVTLAATQMGTATPVPVNWLVVTPVLIYNTPTPANVATAQFVAALATANAATTGTPDPYRVTLVMTVVTATPTPTDIVAAAKTMAAATAAANSIGTATPLPPNWNVVTPIVVTNTPTPANAATAAMQWQVGQSIAVLTGTPPPYAVIAVATATPVLVAIEDPTLLGNDPIWSPPKVVFPAELVGKILFRGEFNRYQGTRRQAIFAVNPNGTGLARLTDSWAYNISEERDSYNAEGTARVFAQQDPNDKRIQIFVEDYLYGTLKPLTAFGAGVAWQPAWSPTANRIVLVSSESRNDELWVVERGNWPAWQYTKNEWEWDHHPSWSPDGSTIVFSSNRTGQDQLWLMDADGSNQRQFTDYSFEAFDPVWVKYSDPYLPLVEPDDGDPRTGERTCLVCLYVAGGE